MKVVVIDGLRHSTVLLVLPSGNLCPGRHWITEYPPADRLVRTTLALDTYGTGLHLSENN